MKFLRLEDSDGSLAEMVDQWKSSCESYDEDFDQYTHGSFSILKEECIKLSGNKSSGVYALKDESGTFHAVCFLNCALIKGYAEPVLRVRHLLLSPYYDFEDLPIEVYSETLAACFAQIIEISNADLAAPHVKIHYRSPYDRSFFAAFAAAIRHTNMFASVESKGMWLYISKEPES
ncbi:MAG: hypothetical protein AAGH74_01670 [Pseudomonadota bacterium]